jgi:hypothetical protein
MNIHHSQLTGTARMHRGHRHWCGFKSIFTRAFVLFNILGPYFIRQLVLSLPAAGTDTGADSTPYLRVSSYFSISRVLILSENSSFINSCRRHRQCGCPSSFMRIFVFFNIQGLYFIRQLSFYHSLPRTLTMMWIPIYISARLRIFQYRGYLFYPTTLVLSLPTADTDNDVDVHLHFCVSLYFSIYEVLFLSDNSS